MAEDKDIIIRIKTDSEKALKAVVDYTDKLNRLRREQGDLKTEQTEVTKTIIALANEQKKLEKDFQSGAITLEQFVEEDIRIAEAMQENKKRTRELSEEIAAYDAYIKDTTATMRGYQKEVQNIVKRNEALRNGQEGSISSLRAELSNLTKEYDNLSREERETAKGKELLDHINKVTDEIKEAEEATQRYYRNVGNYKSALEGAEKAAEGLKESVLGFAGAGNPMLQMLVNTAAQLQSVKKAFAVVGHGAKEAGKQFRALMANPIVAFLAAVVTAITLLKKGLESSEERLNKFRVLIAPLQAVLDAVSKAVGVFCGWLLDLAEIAADGIMWLTKLGESIPYVGNMIKEGNAVTKEYIDLEKSRQEYMRMTRENIVKNAQAEKEISDLKAKFAEKDKYTNKERLQFLEEAISKEREQAEERKRMAEIHFSNLKREAALSDNNAEMNDKLAEAEAAVIKADKELSDKLRELNGQRAEAINAIKAEEAAQVKADEEKRKAARELAEERAKLETEAVREAEDALNELIADNNEKRRAMTRTQYDREIADLRERLEEEKNLTETARNAINQQIIALEQQKNNELRAIDAEEAKRRSELEAQIRLAELHGNEKAILSEKIRVKQTEISTMVQMDNESTEEFKLRKVQTQNELADLEREQRTNKETEERESSARKLAITIEELYGQEEAIMQVKLEAKRTELEAMHQLEGESDEEFKLRKIQTQNEYYNIEHDIAEKQIALEQQKKDAQVKAYTDVMSAMNAMGEHSKALAKIGKIMGLAQIAVDTGKAIASGVAAASGVPFPANLAAIATTVATVLTNMATAMSSIKSAKFATGGLVEGGGTGTSDSIPAMLSNGESVITAQATSAFAPLLSSINQMGGGVPIDVVNIGTQQMGEDMLARAVAKGVASMRPVVSVEEFNRVSNNVQVIESLATL